MPPLNGNLPIPAVGQINDISNTRVALVQGNQLVSAALPGIAAALKTEMGAGNVAGPSSSTDGNIAVFDGATGGAIKDSGIKPVANATGSFTPALKFGGATTGITYSTQAGSYIAIGALVFVSVSLVLTSKGTATGTATIDGLPFASAGSATCSLDGFDLSTLTAGLTGLISGTGQTAVILRVPKSNGYSSATDANINNDSIIRFTMVYNK